MNFKMTKRTDKPIGRGSFKSFFCGEIVVIIRSFLFFLTIASLPKENEF